ncbi:MAG: hypothetical protein RR921_06875, partial [Mucinivorans sp.]
SSTTEIRILLAALICIILLYTAITVSSFLGSIIFAPKPISAFCKKVVCQKLQLLIQQITI